MGVQNPHEVTRLLHAWRTGDENALNDLFPVVYDELRKMAAGHLASERFDHTLQPTALVHEAYLRLLPRETASVEDRAQFLSVAAQAIRRVLVDHGRGRARIKRGGGHLRVTLTSSLAKEDPVNLDILDLDAALERLGAADAIDLKVVELKYFGGLTDAEVAGVMKISERTVRRHWVYARAWLARELKPERPGPA
jgi:RNA polymerase sigma factor (TIGR02999 family)